METTADARTLLWRRWRGRALTLALALAVAYLWWRPLAWVEDVRQPLAPLTLTLLDGAPLDLASLRGRVVLVNFWASWCPPCRREMPDIHEFERDHAGRGFTVVTISHDEAPEHAARFLRERGYAFPTAMAHPAQDAVFGAVTQLPTTAIVDRAGNLRHRVVGQVHTGRLEDLVLPLLDEAAP